MGYRCWFRARRSPPRRTRNEEQPADRSDNLPHRWKHRSGNRLVGHLHRRPCPGHSRGRVQERKDRPQKNQTRSRCRLRRADTVSRTRIALLGACLPRSLVPRGEGVVGERAGDSGVGYRRSHPTGVHQVGGEHHEPAHGSICRRRRRCTWERAAPHIRPSSWSDSSTSAKDAGARS